LGTAAGAATAIDILDGAIAKVNDQRAKLGAISNRLDATVSNLTNIITNTESSVSNIRDADFSKETSRLTRAQILNQAATSMLAQANASKQSVLSLLQG
jgi:flagellin